MKLVTRPRLLLLVVVIATVAGGVWLDRRDVPIREGRVVIDEAFLHRLKVDDPETTHDPAIKALTYAQFNGELLRNMLRAGAVTLDLRQLNRDSVTVTLRQSFSKDSDTMLTVAYTRHRPGLRELLSPSSWKKSLLHRAYWEPLSYNELMRSRYN